MNIATSDCTHINELYGNRQVAPIDPVSWIVDGDVFVMDMYMSYVDQNPVYIPCKKHVRLYMDRGYGAKALGWTNYDDTATTVQIDRGGTICLTTMEVNPENYTTEEEQRLQIGDDSDFSEDEDGYAIQKRSKKHKKKYTVTKRVVLTPQEFGTAIFNEHPDLMFFWVEVRKVTSRPRRIGFLTLCKMLLLLRRLHYAAIGRKWQPGGVEFATHVKCESAQLMAVPLRTASVECA